MGRIAYNGLMKKIAAALLALLPALPAVTAFAVEVAPVDPIIGLSLGGEQKAYPMSLFTERPVVNDTVGHLAVLVFFDRETDYAAAFFRLVGGEPLEFSGQATGMVADDLTTATRWDMTTGRAVGGNLIGISLVPIPTRRTALQEWMRKYPKSIVFEP